MQLREIPTLLSLFLTVVLTTTSYAVVVEDGYFKGTDLRPIGDSRASVLIEDPAAIIIFTLDPGNDASVDQFDDWFQRPRTQSLAIYGVVVTEKDSSSVIVDEAISQRELEIPVFHTTDNLLGGERMRVVVLREGKAKIISGVDIPAIEAAAAGEPAPAAATPVPAVAIDATPAPAVTIATTPEGALTIADTTATVATNAGPKPPVFVNRQYSFSVRFPPPYSYTVAKNGDGAVGIPPPDANLDLRTWASKEESNGPQSAREYAEDHLEFLGSQSQSEVVLERRLVVNDNDLEGRDYVYRYSKPGPSGEKVLTRGRIQVFEIGGTFKIASAEAPAAEYNANRELVEGFMFSFHPTLQAEDMTDAEAADSDAPVISPSAILPPPPGPVLMPPPPGF